MNSTGHAELADALLQLTEAISASNEIADKKEMLENLSNISEQAALPEDHRKMGVLRASWNAIKAGVGPVGNLLALAIKVEELLKGMPHFH